MRKLLERLVAIDSVNPTLVPGGAGEAALARFVSQWLKENGVEVQVDALAPHRANVIGRVCGTGGGRTLMLNAHMDTVGLGGPDGGLIARVEGNRLYGRGAQDMKGSLAVIMTVAAEVARMRLPGDLVITAVADEEALSIGSERVAQTITADAAIVTEPTGEQIAVAHRGFVWLELETRGVAAHGARYDVGEDAIVKMGPSLVALRELDERLAAREQHPLLGRASVHASLVEGGTELSTYPDRCVVKLERRTLPGESVADVEAELRAIAEGADVRSFFSREPLETPADAPIVQLLQRHAGTEIVGVPFWTDAALFPYPTVVYGPTGEGLHTETEWIDLESLERVRSVLLATVVEFCGGDLAGEP